MPGVYVQRRNVLHRVQSVAALSATTLNPLDKNASIALSPDLLTATLSGAGYKAVRGTTSHSAGKYYFEVTLAVGNPAAEDFIFGFANASQPLTDFCGQDNNGVGYDAVGQIWINSSPSTGKNTAVVTDVIGVYADLDGKVFSTRTIHSGAAGNWNGNVANDPTVGGVSFATLAAGPYFPCISLASNANSATANFGASSFAATAPVGTVNW